MIGILSKPSEVRIVEEFFECFKTPWEFYVPDRAYEVILATCDEIPIGINARVLVVYNSKPTQIDKNMGVVASESNPAGAWVEWNGVEFPVYGHVLMFWASGQAILTRKGTGETIGANLEEHRTVRIGFDLFNEVSFLFSKGQPSESAHIATLDLHIAFLRAIMFVAGVRFVEIPPAPAGYNFMLCLTHDVDFVGIRDHKFDHTMWGFVYRCFVGSFARLLAGTLTWSKCVKNWRAGLSLPLVYLGLKDDFWLEFERYLEIERGLGSTFFFIPFKNTPGTCGSRSAPKRRSAKYDFQKMTQQVRDLVSEGCEVALHGINAWQDSRNASVEMCRIREISGQDVAGSRMHWLYWSENSAKALEEVGLMYDSTFGYNDAIGFRAGTTQAFCPLVANSLIELPLNIQDTALFYPNRMKLSETAAFALCKRVIQAYYIHGGVLTINWHTRSLSPERLWDDFYLQLLKELQSFRVWCGTARQISNWFRSRRKLRFEAVEFSDGEVKIGISGTAGDGSAPFTLRVFAPSSKNSGWQKAPMSYVVEPAATVPWNGLAENIIQF